MFFDKRKLLNHSLPKYRLSFILNVFETLTYIHNIHIKHLMMRIIMLVTDKVKKEL